MASYCKPQVPELSRVRIGFVPLTDAAPLLMAKELGYFDMEGVDVELSREPSWSAIRDKVAAGMLDGAQMLAGIPIASTLGVSGMRCPMVTAMSLDLNGNAITVSDELYARMMEAEPGVTSEPPVGADPLKEVIARARNGRGKPITMATVFPVSSHHYELRYWLSAAGIDPDRDIRLVVVPPHEMVERMKQGLIDGYCVGEPWNSLAVYERVGHVLTTSYDLWNNSPEKVFGVTAEWAGRHPNTHRALLRALLQAARWLDYADNRPAAAHRICVEPYVDAPEAVVRASLTGELLTGRELADFHVFHRYAANHPWRSHALWFMTQMARWGQLDRPVNLVSTAEAVYDCDLYREIALELGVPAPTIDHKVEGVHAAPWVLEAATSPIEMGPDRFIDGSVFDPAEPVGYVEAFAISTPRVASAALAAANAAECRP